MGSKLSKLSVLAPKSPTMKACLDLSLCADTVSPGTVNILVHLAEAYFSHLYVKGLFQGINEINSLIGTVSLT